MAKTAIGDAIAATLGDVSTIDTEVRRIPLDQIAPNPLNFYPPPDFDALMELADSIRANGLLEPLIVTQDADRRGYTIISGHSRWSAMKMPFMRNDCPELVKAVPCRVLPPRRKS